MVVDETYYYAQEESYQHRQVKKLPANDDNIDGNPDPFILAESLVVSGVGRAVVSAVGARTRRGLKPEVLDTSSNTPLQVKLENLAAVITKYSLIAAGIILVAGLVNFVITVLIGSGMDFGDALKKICEILTLVIIIVIVSVPEGLPMVIALSLAYSVMRMKDDGVLVKNLNSPEVMGGIDEICTGKTATLTKNEMKVNQFYIQNRLIKNTRKNTLFNCELADSTIQLIQESILYNSESRIEMDDRAYYVPVGNGTEVGLIKFLQDAEIAVHDVIQYKLGKVQTIIPFSPIRKSSAIAVYIEEGDIVRVYLKGAPEKVIPCCQRTLDVDGSVINLDDTLITYLYDDVIRKLFTSNAYRAMGFGYKDMTKDEFNTLMGDNNNFQTEEDRQALLSDMTLLGVVALEDHLRDKVYKAVQYASKGNINVRLVSGDNLETAKATAIRAGIISEAEAEQDYVCMTGEYFREQVGEMRKEIDHEGNVQIDVGDKNAFKQIALKLRVLGRSVPRDKQLLVSGLKGLGKSVAVTGDGINDSDALRTANVGFAMGSGCAVAKDSSDMILINDNFEATLHAVMWGRNIYDNVRRFIQFQVTVNLSALIIVFLAICIVGESPLSAVQLLWVNLIMDTFAAIALAAEKPQASIIRTPPTKEGELVMTPLVWRQIYGVTLWNTVVMVLFVFFGKWLFNLPFEPSDPFYESDGTPTNKVILYTMVFETFIFLQLFNEFNCRCIQPKKYNMFDNLLGSWLFLAIVVGTALLTLFFVEYMNQAFRVTSLTMEQHAQCAIWGATVLVVSIVLKLLPLSTLKHMPILIDENQGIDPNDPLMAAYNKQAQAKAIVMPEKETENEKEREDVV